MSRSNASSQWLVGEPGSGGADVPEPRAAGALVLAEPDQVAGGAAVLPSGLACLGIVVVIVVLAALAYLGRRFLGGK